MEIIETKVKEVLTIQPKSSLVEWAVKGLIRFQGQELNIGENSILGETRCSQNWSNCRQFDFRSQSSLMFVMCLLKILALKLYGFNPIWFR